MFCGLNFWRTVLAVTLGNLVAGIIIMTICAIFPAFTEIILYIVLVLIILFLTYRIVVHFLNKKNNTTTENVE